MHRLLWFLFLSSPTISKFAESEISMFPSFAHSLPLTPSPLSCQTPGRIAELVIGRPGDKGGKLKISGLRTIVLDEFDALLQYDAHVEPTVAIMQALDRQHGRSLQRVLCSATASDVIQTSSSSPTSEGGAVATSSAPGPAAANIESYLRPGYAHASVDEGDLLVTSGVRTLTKGGAVATSARVSRTTIHGTLHVPSRRLALEAVRKILNTEPAPQQALIFVDSPRRVDIVIEKVRFRACDDPCAPGYYLALHIPLNLPSQKLTTRSHSWRKWTSSPPLCTEGIRAERATGQR